MMQRALSAEYLKMKKICLWIPVISAVILLLFSCMEWYLYFRQGEAGVYTGFNVLYMFLSFTMLLTISLLCSTMSEPEHQAQGLKLLFSLPVNRTAFYFAKAIWIGALMLGCCALIIGGTAGIWLAYTDLTLPFPFLVKQSWAALARPCRSWEYNYFCRYASPIRHSRWRSACLAPSPVCLSPDSAEHSYMSCRGPILPWPALLSAGIPIGSCWEPG